MIATKSRGNHDAAALLPGICLNGNCGITSGLKRMLREGNGAVLLDKDGVFTSIDRQIERALVLEFSRHADMERGIAYDFDRDAVYRLFGTDPRYNDGPEPILALMALNKESRGRGGGTPNAMLREIVQSPDAAERLDEMISRHTEHERGFVAQEMYWWREPGGFFRSEEAVAYIDPYTDRHGITSRDAAVALLDAGYRIGIITNAPEHDLRAAGFTDEDMMTRIADQGHHVDGRIMVLTRKHLGESRKKPDPYGLHYAASAMGVSLASSVYGGDTVVDIEFAMAAGAVPVGFESGMGSGVHLKRGCPELHVLPDLQTLAAGLLR